MKDKTRLILFFLQTLHYRDDLEQELFKNLQKSESILIEDLYGQKVHGELANNTTNILKEFGVLQKRESKYIVDKSSLEEFILLIDVAKASRSYKWPTNRPKPFLYVSPPTLITTELSGDIDDISNLLINLVRSAANKISIMSPFTNKEGLKSILAPLKACKSTTQITIYLTADEEDKEMIYKQIKNQIPEKMLDSLSVYFCPIELMVEDSLPHAKLLIVDSKKGYLGSANFTKQGLTSRFEVGVELDEQQCKAVDKLLNILIKKNTFVLYPHFSKEK